MNKFEVLSGFYMRAHSTICIEITIARKILLFNRFYSPDHDPFTIGVIVGVGVGVT